MISIGWGVVPGLMLSQRADVDAAGEAEKIAAELSTVANSTPASSPSIEAGIVFADQASYLCVPRRGLGNSSADEVLALKSSCECTRPSVVQYQETTTKSGRALRVDFKPSLGPLFCKKNCVCVAFLDALSKTSTNCIRMYLLKRAFVGLITVLIGAQIIFGSVACADETAKDILERSQMAMSPPVRVVIDSNGIEATVHQKLLASGVLATRTDFGHPVLMTILENGDERFELYAHENTAIDMKFQHVLNRQQVMELRERETSIATISPNIAREFNLDFDIEFNGRQCRRLSRTMSTERLDILQSFMPIMTDEKIPTETRYFVDKESFEVAGVEMYSAKGQRILLSKYNSLTHPSDLLDDFFLLPDNYRLLKPISLDEYVSMKVALKSSELRLKITELNNRLHQVNRVRELNDRSLKIIATTRSSTFYLKQLFYSLLFFALIFWATRQGLRFRRKGK